VAARQSLPGKNETPLLQYKGRGGKESPSDIYLYFHHYLCSKERGGRKKRGKGTLYLLCFHTFQGLRSLFSEFPYAQVVGRERKKGRKGKRS